MREFYLPSNDAIFHRLFGEERNRDLLVDLLTAVLEPDSPIVGASLLPTEQRGESLDDKTARLDVRVRLADGQQVDVEMQNTPRRARHERALYYWARIYESQLRSGEDYTRLRPCVVIWFLGYRELQGIRFHSIFKVLEVHDHEPYSDALELHTVELPKLPPRGADDPEGKLVAWGRFLAARSAAELKELAMAGDPVLQKAWAEVERLNQDPATRELAYERETALLSYQCEIADARWEGREEGREEGRQEGEAIAVVKLLEGRGVALSDQQRARILECDDSGLVDKWLIRAATAEHADDVFAD